MEEARRQRLTARRKFQVYLETRQPGANAGEILRRHGLHLNDLRQIEGVVEQAAVEALTGRRNGHRLLAGVSREEHEALVRERHEKEQARPAAADGRAPSSRAGHERREWSQPALGVGHPEAADRDSAPVLVRYAVLDQWSRKGVGWHVSDRETSAEAPRAGDQALLAEGLEHGPMPAALPDPQEARSSTVPAAPWKELTYAPMLWRRAITFIISRVREP